MPLIVCIPLGLSIGFAVAVWVSVILFKLFP